VFCAARLLTSQSNRLSPPPADGTKHVTISPAAECGAGQNVEDIIKYSGLDGSLDILERLLEWRHLAPTAPGTPAKLSRLLPGAARARPSVCCYLPLTQHRRQTCAPKDDYVTVHLQTRLRAFPCVTRIPLSSSNVHTSSSLVTSQNSARRL
jgi:hypothetical protein